MAPQNGHTDFDLWDTTGPSEAGLCFASREYRAGIVRVQRLCRWYTVCTQYERRRIAGA